MVRGCEFIRISTTEVVAPEVLGIMAIEDTSNTIKLREYMCISGADALASESV
jgi:hypothetical protein